MVTYRASKLLYGGQGVLEKSSLRSHNLMLANGYIQPVDNGLYAILPRVIDKLVHLIESELNSLGAFKLTAPLLNPKELWLKSGRWENMRKELFLVEDRNDRQYCLQPTAEEMITKLLVRMGSPKRSSFPVMLYQTNHKFRDERRPKFGLFRSREFLMNDLYSFDLSEEDALKTYSTISKMYCHILKDMLGLETYVVEADTGEIGGKTSHEYHVLNDSSDRTIYVCKNCKKGIDTALFAQGHKLCSSCSDSCFLRTRSIEIAHTFQLGVEFSQHFKAAFGSDHLWMNCFGLGIGRIVCAAIDAFSSNKNSIRLPGRIAPYKLAVVSPSLSTIGCNAAPFTESLISQLSETDQLKDDLFVDDRSKFSVGKRILLTAALGIPHIFATGSFTARSLESKPLVEYFYAGPKDEIPRKVANFTHRDVFQFVKTL